MGCCCSCCRCCDVDVSTRESCGNIYFPTRIGPQGQQTTPTNRGEQLCRRAAVYFTVPLCSEHRDALHASIDLDRRGARCNIVNDVPGNRGPPGQTCLGAEGCKIAKCRRPFYCRASVCREHFEMLAAMADVEVPLSQRARVPPQPREEHRGANELDGRESRRISELDGDESPVISELGAEERQFGRERVAEAPAARDVKGGRIEEQVADEAPPPYEGPASSSSVADSHLQRRVKRSGM